MANGNSAATLAASSEQDEIRRAKKRKQREHAKTGRSSAQSFNDGLQRDRINEFGIALLDQLEPVMTSSSTKANTMLAQALHTYVTNFTEERSYHASYWVRHKDAVKVAQTTIDGARLQQYAARRFQTAMANVANTMLSGIANAG